MMCKFAKNDTRLFISIFKVIMSEFTKLASIFLHLAKVDSVQHIYELLYLQSYIEERYSSYGI